jgi:Flp pilus assembly protein TadG
MAITRPDGVPHRVPRPSTIAPAKAGKRTGRARGPWIAMRRHMHSLSRGQALVELALVTPVLLLLLLAAIDLGRVFYAEIAVSNSARAAAMVAATQVDGFSAGNACNATTNPVMCAATTEDQSGMVSIGTSDVAMTCSPSCAQTYGTTVTVTVMGHFHVLTPLLWAFTGGSNVTFAKAATANVIVTPPGTGLASPSASPSASASATATPTSAPTPTPTSAPTPTPTPTCAPPQVGFSYSQQNKNKPVNFSSTSAPTSGSCAISYWRWDYGDGTYDAGAVATAVHSFPAKKTTYNVQLTVTTPGGTYSYIAAVTTK